MTQEDNELVYKDLCARLPYGVCYKHFTWDDERGETCIAAQIYSINSDGYVKNCYDDETDYIDNVRPYLFPLSSMTEEQRNEFLSVAGYQRREEDCGRHTETYYYDMVGHEHNFYPNSDAIDWLNKNHFDYRGLIEKSLAIDATGKGIY